MIARRFKRWVFMPVGACLVALAGCSSGSELAPQPQVIEVTGRDFQWYFTYPGPDATFGTADDIGASQKLTLALGRPVTLEVTSTDYIYTLRALELDLLEVAVPDMTFSVTFTPRQAGEFELEIDPLCGYAWLHENQAMGSILVSAD